MPNLLLTNYCNRSCPYCFALDAMQGSASNTMTFREIVLLADQMIAAGRANVGLLGGEPTLHPEFVEIVDYFLRREFTVRVFTNALCRPEVLDRLAALPRERLWFIVNVNAPEIEKPENHERQVAFMRRVADRCDLSVNVYQRGMKLDFAADIVERADLRNVAVRIGLAQPVVGTQNEFLNREDYRSVAAPIVALAEALWPRRVHVGFDCGFPLCAFDDDQLGRLFRYGAKLRFVCATAVDIAPGAQAWTCFPLAKQTKVEHEPQDDLVELTEHFEGWLRGERLRLGPGIFEECATCVHRELGQCAGGCLAHLA